MVSKLMRQKESRRNLRKRRKRHNNPRRRSAGVRRPMFTHRSGDGQSGAVHEPLGGEGAPPAFLVRAETTEDDLGSSGINCKPSRLRKKRDFAAFAIIVILGQVIISVTLKKYGWIERDINEIVSERFLPNIQQLGLEQMHTFPWSPFNDSLYEWINNQSISIGGYTSQESRPGSQLADKGARGKYPIVMIPGFVTSGLEVWGGKECAQKYFRQRMWGGVGSMQHWLMERHCVMEHLALDPLTGKDPEDIRIRAAQGFEAADYFLGNYWVWGKILKNLADIGYDGSTMSMESYDWRLAFPMLEERDGFLTKLKYKIEAFNKASGKKVVLTSHSLGTILVHYFFAWVTTSEADGGGGGGKKWVDRHIHAYVNIAGSQLGVPKAATALLSGEMSDTIFMGAVGSLVEQFIGRKLRRDLWMTWGSLWSMLPKGGDKLWNIGADMRDHQLHEHQEESGASRPSKDMGGNMIIMTDDIGDEDEKVADDLTCTKENLADVATEASVNEAIQTFSSRKGQTVSNVIDFLMNWGGGMGPAISPVQLHSFDPKSKASKESWHDISRTPLPHAPNMRVYCLYGIGLDTERAYYYRRNKGEGVVGVENKSVSQSQKIDTPFILDNTVEDAENDVIHGVKYVDGDASVPLLSLGYMCADAWRRKDSGLNPSKAKVVTREYKHKEEFSVDMRKGPYSSDHVDILGNVNMMEDFLKVVSDYDVESVDDLIVSDIREIAKRINKRGGLKRRKRWPFHF